MATTYFPYEQCMDIEIEWKMYYRSIYITWLEETFYFTQENSDIKIQLQVGQEYELKNLKQICYHKSKNKQGIPTFKYELRR